VGGGFLNTIPKGHQGSAACRGTRGSRIPSDRKPGAGRAGQGAPPEPRFLPGRLVRLCTI